jgi:hypothetical protein
MNRTNLITSQPFDVRILSNGRDISEKSPIVQVQYRADGSGSRTLRDGSVVAGRWQFLNPQQTQIEVNGPEGTSRWVVVELSDRIYRKVDIDTGVEFLHLPQGR